MSAKPPIRSTIDSYRKKRQQLVPFIIGVAAILLVIIGIVVLVLAFTGPGRISFTLFPTRTPTPSITPLPTDTSLPTETPTITPTPTDTPTPTPSAPFFYEVQEGDSLDSIAKKFNLGDNGVLMLLYLNPNIDRGTQTIFIGQKIMVPPPGWPMPTDTPIPPDLPRGTKINYYVQYGDTLDSIARKFNSTVEAILKENKIEDPNTIYVGQLLVIPVNLVTPVPTKPATSTSTQSATQTPVTVTP